MIEKNQFKIDSFFYFYAIKCQLYAGWISLKPIISRFFTVLLSRLRERAFFVQKKPVIRNGSGRYSWRNRVEVTGRMCEVPVPASRSRYFTIPLFAPAVLNGNLPCGAIGYRRNEVIHD